MTSSLLYPLCLPIQGLEDSLKSTITNRRIFVLRNQTSALDCDIYLPVRHTTYHINGQFNTFTLHPHTGRLMVFSVFLLLYELSSSIVFYLAVNTRSSLPSVSLSPTAQHNNRKIVAPRNEASEPD